MPSLPELDQPLTDGIVSVRGAAERDIPEVLIAYQDDPALHLRMDQPRPPSGAELGRRIERAEADRIAGRRLALTIVEPGDDTCGGQVYVRSVDWDNARAELGIWVAPQLRGRGLGSRALRLVARWLLSDGRLARVQVLTESDNGAMLAAARAAGFSYEGILRGYTLGQLDDSRAARSGEAGRRAGGKRERRVDKAVLSLVARDLPG